MDMEIISDRSILTKNRYRFPLQNMTNCSGNEALPSEWLLSSTIGISWSHNRHRYAMQTVEHQAVVLNRQLGNPIRRNWCSASFFGNGESRYWSVDGTAR